MHKVRDASDIQCITQVSGLPKLSLLLLVTRNRGPSRSLSRIDPHMITQFSIVIRIRRAIAPSALRKSNAGRLRGILASPACRSSVRRNVTQNTHLLREKSLKILPSDPGPASFLSQDFRSENGLECV